jgi:hypothetical protein
LANLGNTCFFNSALQYISQRFSWHCRFACTHCSGWRRAKPQNFHLFMQLPVTNMITAWKNRLNHAMRSNCALVGLLGVEKGSGFTWGAFWLGPLLSPFVLASLYR